MFNIPIHVLIVDDEKDFAEMLSLRLMESGDRVQVAHGGKECLDVLAGKPDIEVVLLDIKMPGMDGIETLKEIKNRFPLVEVIMLTGHGTTQSAVDSMKLGAFDYLLKPAEFDDLRQKLLKARKRKDEHQERIRKAEAQLLARRGGNM